jgi:hypothetical protein
MYDMRSDNEFKSKGNVYKRCKEAVANAVIIANKAVKALQVSLGMMDVAMATARWRCVAQPILRTDSILKGYPLPALLPAGG